MQQGLSSQDFFFRIMFYAISDEIVVKKLNGEHTFVQTCVFRQTYAIISLKGMLCDTYKVYPWFLMEQISYVYNLT